MNNCCEYIGGSNNEVTSPYQPLKVCVKIRLSENSSIVKSKGC